MKCRHLESKLKLKSIIFWDITPCSLLIVNRRFGGTYCLHIHGRRNKFSKKPASKQVESRILLAEFISLTLTMEAICSSETSIDTQRTTLRYIPEDDTLHNHSSEKLKSYKLKLLHEVYCDLYGFNVTTLSGIRSQLCLIHY
jgi:hypothetical protein